MSEKHNQQKSLNVQESQVFNSEEGTLPSIVQNTVLNKQKPWQVQNPHLLVSQQSRQAKLEKIQTQPTKQGIQGTNEMMQAQDKINLQVKETQLFQLERSIIPLSHAKRQKSLSPIKNQHSVASQKEFVTSGPKLIMTLTPKVQTVPDPSIKSQVKSTTSYLFTKPEQVCTKPAVNFYRRQIYENFPDSGNRSNSRRTQIFSSDKKRAQKLLASNNNSVAEQILNQNKVQRGTQKQFRLQNDAYISKTSKILQNPSPVAKKQRVQSIQTLSNSKQKQIKKLQEIFSSPQKASLEYWESIYPQSKKYLASLTSVLSQEKKVLEKWQFDLQATLRETLFQVEEIILQKMYEICRFTVKRWVQEEIQSLQGFCNEKFAYFPRIKRNIQSKERDLDAVQKAMESFQRVYQNNLERSRVYRLLEGTILSSEYTDEISQISLKVKDLISKSEEIALSFCQDKLRKAKQLISFQYDHENHRLDKRTYELLKALFNGEDDKKQLKKSSKKLIIPEMSKEQKNKKFNDRSQVENAQTVRQATFSEFSQNKVYVPMSSYRKQNTGLKIRNKQKEFEQFQSEFQIRKKNYVRVVSSVYGQENKIDQIPVSHKGGEDNDFQRKLSSLLKKINDQNTDQKEQKDNEAACTPKNYNEYQQNLKKKKQANRQNFFRYSMQ